VGEPIRTAGDLAGICGHDGTDWIKALIDSGGRLQVDIVDSGGADLKDVLDKLADILTELNAKLETADLDLDGSGRLSANAHGYIAGAWQKQPLAWGISDSVSEAVSDTNLGADTQTLSTTPILAGEVHVASAINFRVDSATCTRGQLQIVVGGVSLVILTQASPVAYTWYLKTGEFVLAEGDYIALSMTGLTAGDDAYLRYAGYRMDVDL